MALVKEQQIDRDFIERLIKILEERLEDEHFGVSELAEAACVSRSQLHRKVHAYNGNSTSQFIREYRLQKAMELLHSNENTVAEVAYKVGFSSPTYFNTCFKEYYGFSPGEARFQDLNEGPVRPKRKRYLIAVILLFAVILAGFGFYYWSPGNTETMLSVEPAGTKTTIAVLPLKNWSGDPELEYISDGMTDAIITRLNLVGTIHVLPFSSVLKYKSSDQDASIIARELGVQNILQGNFQLSGDQVKITLHLIDGITNRNYWSEVYTGKWKTDEIFTMQSDVAEAVADEMDIDLNDLTLLSIRENPTENKEAYVCWLQGNYQMNKYNLKGFQNALNLYRRAISLDSEFMETHISLAYLYLFGGASWGLFNEQEALLSAKQHLTKALELDSTNINAKRGLNDVLYLYEWDFANMEKNYLEYSNITWTYSLQTGRFEGLLTQIDEAIVRNPTGYFNPLFKMQTLFYLNRTDEAKKILEQTEALFDDQIMYLRLASRYYYYMGEFEKSKEQLNKLLNKFPDRPPLVLWLGAIHAERDGNKKLEEQYLEELQKRYEANESGSPAWFTALYYSCVEDYENTFMWLEKSYDRHEVEMIWLREQPMLRPLRADPRYVELYHKVGFPMPPHPN